MIVLICGGREYQERRKVMETLDNMHGALAFSMVIQGGAQGADLLGKEWAMSRGVHYATVPALWDAYGKSAGMKRNAAMLLLRPDMVVAFPGGVGTKGMCRLARTAGIPVEEVA